MRHGHGTCTTAQVLIRAVKSLAPSNIRNRTWQGTVPETSAIVYGAWCTPTYSAMRGANST